MARVMLLMNVTKGGRSKRLALRNHLGNIIKTGLSNLELAVWVCEKYGELYMQHISCN